MQVKNLEIQIEKYKEKITFSLAKHYNETWITETRISEGLIFCYFHKLFISFLYQ